MVQDWRLNTLTKNWLEGRSLNIVKLLATEEIRCIFDDI